MNTKKRTNDVLYCTLTGKNVTDIGAKSAIGELSSKLWSVGFIRHKFLISTLSDFALLDLSSMLYWTSVVTSVRKKTLNSNRMGNHSTTIFS